MNVENVRETIKALLADSKGILAMDESTASCNKRFAKLGIPEIEEMRRAWRGLIITTPKLSDAISGFILYDETIRQKNLGGVSFVEIIKNAGIIPGIKVDGGLKEMPWPPHEKVTEGLDGLAERLKEYADMGARFAKWRAAFEIGEGIPTRDAIEENVKRLAEYAAIAQQAGIVPIVEPEVLMDGGHTMERCRQVTGQVLKAVFAELEARGVAMEGMILKPNMVVPGLECKTQESVNEVADATVALLKEIVPANVGGIAFLSGGQSGELAAARLSAMHIKFRKKLPWPLTFSYSRAIQYPALEIWAGKEENISAAQESLRRRAEICRLSTRGEYVPEMEG